MSLKFDQTKAWKAIADAAPVIFGPPWRNIIVQNTPIEHSSLIRWESGSVNPGSNRMIPRLEAIGNLMSTRLIAFEDALETAEYLVRYHNTGADLETPEGFDALATMAEAFFGPSWQKQLSVHLAAKYDYSVSHSSFSVWKSEGKTRRRLLEIVGILLPECRQQLNSMKNATGAYWKATGELKADFPPNKSVKLRNKPSADFVPTVSADGSMMMAA